MHIFVTGLLYVPLIVRIETTRTIPSVPGCVSIMHPICNFSGASSASDIMNSHPYWTVTP